MTKEEVIETAILFKKQGLSVEQIAHLVSKTGYLTRYGQPPTKSTIAFWLSTYGENLPDRRKVRTRKPEAHYKRKKSEANKRYYAKNRERILAYHRDYYKTYLKGS